MDCAVRFTPTIMENEINPNYIYYDNGQLDLQSTRYKNRLRQSSYQVSTQRHNIRAGDLTFE